MAEHLFLIIVSLSLTATLRQRDRKHMCGKAEADIVLHFKVIFMCLYGIK